MYDLTEKRARLRARKDPPKLFAIRQRQFRAMVEGQSRDLYRRLIPEFMQYVEHYLDEASKRTGNNLGH